MQSILEQADNYRRFAESKSNAHYLLAEKNRHKHTLLGTFVTLFSTIVGTTIFATITKTTTSLTIQIFTGFLSVMAAVLAAFQTFFRFSELSQQHKNAAASYEAIRHKLDLFLLTYSDINDLAVKQKALEDFQNITVGIDKIAESSPTIPDKVWDTITKNTKLSGVFDILFKK
jgi:hypothetical protein